MASAQGDASALELRLGIPWAADPLNFATYTFYHPFMQILVLGSMRIACLQFNPELGRIPENITRANALLQAASPQNIDLLLLPELAFTGYNYPSLASILPHLEPTASGPSTVWARATALRLNCIVTVGYPERCTSPPSNTNVQTSSPAGEVIAYNSTVSVSPSGEILAHYRKTHLYYTDETWAQESPSGWLSTGLTFAPKTRPEQIVRANFGICMDLNPRKFEAPWEAYEFASHALVSGSELLVLSMAWLTNLDASELAAHAEEPDLHTLSYWIERLKPLVEAEKEVIAMFGNRCGEEAGKSPLGVEEGVRYAGSSWVGKIGKGDVRIWGILGRAQEAVIIADTEKEPEWVLRLQPRNEEAVE